jgi:hypothetical protein
VFDESRGVSAAIRFSTLEVRELHWGPHVNSCYKVTSAATRFETRFMSGQATWGMGRSLARLSFGRRDALYTSIEMLVALSKEVVCSRARPV